MGDLVKHVTELKADGRITEQRDPGKILPQFDDWIDSGSHQSRPLPVADNSPASRNRSFRNKKNFPK